MVVPPDAVSIGSIRLFVFAVVSDVIEFAVAVAIPLLVRLVAFANGARE